METIGSLWWLWLAGMLLCWGYVAFQRLRERQSVPPSSPNKSLAQPADVLVGARYLGFVFLVLLVFAMAVNLITFNN